MSPSFHSNLWPPTFQCRAWKIKLLQNSSFPVTSFGRCEATSQLDPNNFREPTSKESLRGFLQAARVEYEPGC